jgi:hypothetical protein
MAFSPDKIQLLTVTAQRKAASRERKALGSANHVHVNSTAAQRSLDERDLIQRRKYGQQVCHLSPRNGRNVGLYGLKQNVVRQSEDFIGSRVEAILNADENRAVSRIHADKPIGQRLCFFLK